MNSSLFDYRISSIRNRPSNTNRASFRNHTNHILLPIVTAPRLLTAHINYIQLGFVLHRNTLRKNATFFLRFYSRFSTFRGVYPRSFFSFRKFPFCGAFSNGQSFHELSWRFHRCRARFNRFRINETHIRKERFRFSVKNVCI